MNASRFGKADMNRTKLKNYAPQARRDFIQAMTDRAAFYGLTAKKTEPVVERGDVAVIGGRSHPRAVAKKRKALEDRIERHGFGPTMEALAYTWFNRLVAVRFMELHGYLDHGYRVLSHPEGKPTPEILEHAEHVDLPGLKKEAVIDLKLAGNKEGELYRLLLTAQCNALHAAMPFLFEKIDDETELLLPDNLLHSDSLIRMLVGEIDEEDWQPVEIIGWLYQFYISDRKDEVIGKVVASEDIPAATQLFTPNWIVKYLVQNTLGRLWLATYPHSTLREQMEYYVEPAEQTPEVREQLKAITPTSLNPEELTFLDPACGSALILVEAYDVFKAIYQERGYRAKDIPALILKKNLFGLEIDDRAAQLAAFALMMKARADDRRIFDNEAKPNVVAIQETDSAFHSDDLPDELSQHRNIIEKIAELFRKAKTHGSLIQIPGRIAAKVDGLEEMLRECMKRGDLVSSVSARHILDLLRQLRMLARQYDAVVANPPYMGSKHFNTWLKDYIKENYKAAKADLCVAFIDRGLAFTTPTGLMSMITMQSWMFLSSFEDFRISLMQDRTMRTMIHLGPHAFPEIGGQVVQVTAFAVNPLKMSEYRGSYRRLIEGQSHEKESRFHTATTYTPSNDDFAKIPGSPVAYWVSEALRNVFKAAVLLETIASPRQGLATGENARFVRWWAEVSLDRLGLRMESRAAAMKSGRKWFPYNKGGEFRKWYGNQGFIVDWQDDGNDIRNFVDDAGSLKSRPQNMDFYFQPSLSWSKVTIAGFALRSYPQGHVFDVAGCSIFMNNPVEREVLLGCMNSPVMSSALNSLSPTVNFEVGHVASFPVMPELIARASSFTLTVEKLIELGKSDWDAHETSWDFATLPVLLHKQGTLQQSQEAANVECLTRFVRMKELEEENNRLFIDAYGLQDELAPDVPDDQITLYRPDRKNDIQRLLSYAIGCMMGRYSLDKSGLIYANSGNQGFDASQYKTFRADDDGIIPLLETDWGIRDDAANRIVEFIGVAWPKDHLEENLEFIADSLGPNNGEQPRDTIRRYLATGFTKHHLSMYKKRPIYWLFSSGKQRAFQCLVYLHRYHEGTLARMRTEYVIPLQGKLAARIEQLEGDKAKATSTSHRNKLQRQQSDLLKQQTELAAFEEKLKHAADQKISLDLDDGVKVNYAKFGDLLAESKAITGGKDDE
jgi:hypothetical protein